MNTRNKVWLALSTLLVFSMLLAACGGTTTVETVVVTQEIMVEGTPQVETIVVTATPVPPTEVPPTPEPQASDTAVLALQQEPDTLHPGIGSMMAKTIVLGAVFVGCVGQNEAAEWIALGCTQVPTLENGGAAFVGEGADKHLEVTYEIVDGWRWTDGTPVTPKDAIYWWYLQMQPDFEVADRSGIESIYNVEAVDDKTIKVSWLSENQVKAAIDGSLAPVETEFGQVSHATFKDDYAATYTDWTGPVVNPVYWSFIGWWPSHVLSAIPAAEQAASDFSKKPLGDGPFFVEEWKQGQEIVLKKAEQPFPLGDAKLNSIVFRFFGETAAVLAALQNGEIDAVTGTGGLTVNNAPDLDKIEEAGIYDMQYEPGYQWEHIDLNTQKFPLDDMKVRQALYHAIDKQALVDKLYYGKQSTTDLPVPPGLSWAYTDTYNKYPYDPEKAKALLAEAGWDCSAMPCTKEVNGETKKLEFTLFTTDRADRQALAQVVQQMWKAVNVGVNLQFLYGRGLFATAAAGGPLNSHTFDAAIYTWITGDDPQFVGLYGCSGGQNYPQWCNAEADAQLEINELNPDTSLSRELRKPALEEFFKIWTAEVPVIPLFSNTRVYAARPGFVNWKPGPTSASPDTWNAWEWELSK
jgi:peptide/nickel transport system substrate-binding protein